MTKKNELLKQIKELIISNPEYFAIVNKDENYDNIRPEVNELLYQLKHEAKIRANNELTIAEKAIRSASEFLNNVKMVSSEYGVEKLTTLYEKVEHELKIAKNKIASENYIAILEAEKITSSSLATANSVISESKSIIRNAKIEEQRNREIRRGKALAGCLRIAIVLGIMLFVLVIGWYFFGPADRIYTVQDLQKNCSGSCYVSAGSLSMSNYATVNLGSDFDFSLLEIDFAEVMEKGNTIEVYIGPYKAWTGIGNCKYYSGQVCYKGWWYYIDPPGAKPIGASSGEIEIFYDEKSTPPLKIRNIPIDGTTIRIGDSHIMGLDQGTSLTPKPVEGEKKISCSNCKIKEVKVYYDFIARMKGLIG